jgi:peroxiredoxin
LGQLREIESQLIAIGVQLIGIAPDRPENLRESIAKHKLGFRLLSDAQMVGAQAFGVAYRLDEPTLQQLKEFGIDVEKASGEKHHQLPVPAVFLVGTDGLIRFQYVNPDYKVRLDPELLLSAARIIFERKRAPAS